MRELQLDDIAVGPLLRIKEVHKDQPTWSMISDWHPQAKSYWAQWNQLVIREGVLYRKWEETDGSRVRWQMVGPRKLKDEVLEQSHTAVTAGHFGDGQNPTPHSTGLLLDGSYLRYSFLVFEESSCSETSGCFETISGCRANGAYGHGCPWSFSREQSRK